MAIETPTQILIPRSAIPTGVQCGSCPNVIYKNQEAKGKLFVISGRPICARCRILRSSPLKNKILADSEKYKDNEIEREKRLQRQADAQALRVAEETQRATRTKIRRRKQK